MVYCCGLLILRTDGSVLVYRECGFGCVGGKMDDSLAIWSTDHLDLECVIRDYASELVGRYGARYLDSECVMRGYASELL